MLWAGKAVVQPYTPLNDKTSSVAANGVACITPNVPLKILIINMGNKAQKLVRNQKVATMMPNLTGITPTPLDEDRVLGLTTNKSLEVVHTQSDAYFKEEKPSAAHLNLDNVLKGHRERLRQVLTKFDKMWDEHLGEINVTFHCISLKPEARPVTQRPYHTGSNAREFVAQKL